MKNSERYKTLYSKNEGPSERLSIWQKFTKTDIDKYLKDKKDLNILEIGVGTNGLIYSTKKHFPNNHYFGVDLSESVIKLMDTNGIKSNNIDIGSEQTPFDENFFDVIIMNEVIEHIFDCQFALNEIYRILKKGGKFYISTHNTFNIIMRLKYLLGIIPCGSLDVSDEKSLGEHIRIFNENILLKLLTRSGFKKGKINNMSWTQIGNISFYTKSLTSLLSRHLYYICEK